MDSLASSYSRLALEADSEDEYSVDSEDLFEPFRFFDLPAELRRKILDYVYRLKRTLDIDVRVTRLLSTFTVSKRFYMEATQSFYGSNTFILLPTHGSAAHKKAVPLIRCFSTYAKSFITSLEFRLGPFWTSPPRCWVVDDSLGLESCESLRVLKVYIEIDPSLAVFNGFRSAKLSYTQFAGDLLEQIIRRLPNICEVQIDGRPSVTRELPLMSQMVQVTMEAGIRVSWGPGQDFSSVGRTNMHSMSQGMVPFYSSSPLHRNIIEDTSVLA